MLERGLDCVYWFCDIDPASTANLKESAARLGLESRPRVKATDGMTALHDALTVAEPTDTILAHIDPYDPRSPGTSGLSALDLARELIDHEAGLMYWYGFDRPERRASALDELSTGTSSRPPWCGDVMVTAATEPRTRDDGDLGLATTPGTGFGIVCANISDVFQHGGDVGVLVGVNPPSTRSAWRKLGGPLGASPHQRAAIATQDP